MTVSLILAHGASGTAASMRPHVEGLRRRGVKAIAIDIPKGSAERALPVFRRHLDEAPGGAAVGGHSYGGRVASLLCAEQGDRMPSGLVLLSYPLHRPGDSEEIRTEHWRRIACPVCGLGGTNLSAMHIVDTATGRWLRCTCGHSWVHGARPVYVLTRAETAECNCPDDCECDHGND